jgi:hypothetical protein
MGTLFNEIYKDKTEEHLIEIYNDLVKHSNEYDKMLPLKTINNIQANSIYTDTTFENQTLCMIKRHLKRDLRYYSTSPIAYKSFTDFSYKNETNYILSSMIVTSLNKDKLIDARIIISNDTYVASNYIPYFKYKTNCDLLETGIYRSNNSIYNELIFFEDEKELTKKQKFDDTEFYEKQLSEIFNTKLEIKYKYGAQIDSNLKIIVDKNIFNKVSLSIVINDISNKRYFMSVRAFDSKPSFEEMLYTIMSDSLNYIKLLKKGKFNAGETLLKLQACIGKLSNINK